MTRKVDASYRFCLMCVNRATHIDQMGNPWCKTHKQRHDLMNWGKEHDWPMVNCQAAEETVDIRKGRNRYYAVGEGYALWFTACSVGSDHFMDTLAATVLAPSTEQ